MVPIRQLQGILFRLNELEAASNFSRTQSIRLSRYQPSMIVSRRLSTRDLELTSSFSITSAQQGNFEKPRRVCHACRGFCHPPDDKALTALSHAIFAVRISTSYRYGFSLILTLFDPICVFCRITQACASQSSIGVRLQY